MKLIEKKIQTQIDTDSIQKQNQMFRPKKWWSQTHRLDWESLFFWMCFMENLEWCARAGHIADLDESLCKLAKILELLFVKDWDLARPSTPCIFIAHKMNKKSW